MGAISLRARKKTAAVSFPFEKDCQRAPFHLTHFALRTNNFSALKFKKNSESYRLCHGSVIGVAANSKQICCHF